MKKTGLHLTRWAERGSALVITLCMFTVMALVAGITLSAVSSRYKTAWRTAAWHESLLTAESGVDATIAQIAGLLPDVQLNPQTGLSLATTTLSSTLSNGLTLQPGGLNLANGLTLAVSPAPLVHGGDGPTTSQATVSIDILPLNQLLSANLLSGVLGLLSAGTPPSINLLRLRSTGTVYLTGGSTAADVFTADADLLRAALVKDPVTGKAVTKPYVSRQIEVLLKPVFPFQNGVATDGPVNAPNSGTVFDSFSSASALTSTNGLYDSSKRRSNIAVSANSNSFAVAGKVYGNINTDGANVVKNSQITGTVNNSYFETLPTLSVPNWAGAATVASGTTSITAGTLLAPTQFKYSQVTGTLHVKASLVGGLGGLLGLGSLPVVGGVISNEADIFVSGNFTGTLIVDPGVKVRFYVEGNVQMGAGGLQNATTQASNLEILGVPGAASPTMSIDTTGGVVAAIYAPGHAVTLAGNGDFSGAVTAAKLTVSGSAGVHFDESLALTLGPILGYSLVSWQEITQ